MILDLLVRADDDPSSHPYEKRRERIAGGEVVYIWENNALPGFSEYGIMETTSDKFVIVRVPDAQNGDAALLTEEETAEIAPSLMVIRGRRRKRGLRMQDFTGVDKALLQSRRMPNVSLIPLELRQPFIDAVPGIDKLPRGQVRDTVWDVSMTRAQIMSFLDTKPVEAKDGNGRPQEGTPLRKHGFKIRDN